MSKRVRLLLVALVALAIPFVYVMVDGANRDNRLRHACVSQPGRVYMCGRPGWHCACVEGEHTWP
jgi:hypothetical protein